MRVVAISLGSIVLITLLASSTFAQFSEGLTISGRLMYQNGGFGCEGCEVLLETMGGQVLAFARVDALGGFFF
jgi:hypothetical protein